MFLIYLVPDTLLFIPLFKVLGMLGLLNSLGPRPRLPDPLGALLHVDPHRLLRVDPREFDEAAYIDGASHLQMLVRIFIPVAMPGIVAATMFSFTVSWAGFLYPLAFLFSSDQRVLTTGIVEPHQGGRHHWGGLMAGAVLAALPPVLLYVFLMDYYVSGLTAGGTKG